MQMQDQSSEEAIFIIVRLLGLTPQMLGILRNDFRQRIWQYSDLAAHENFFE